MIRQPGVPGRVPRCANSRAISDIQMTERHIVREGKRMSVSEDRSKTVHKDEKIAIGVLGVLFLLVFAISVGCADPSGGGGGNRVAPGAAASSQPSATPGQGGEAAGGLGRYGGASGESGGAGDDDADGRGDAEGARIGGAAAESRPRSTAATATARAQEATPETVPARTGKAAPEAVPTRTYKPKSKIQKSGSRTVRKLVRRPRPKPKRAAAPRSAILVHPGGFCGNSGAVGVAKNGRTYVCRDRHWRRY